MVSLAGNVLRLQLGAQRVGPVVRVLSGLFRLRKVFALLLGLPGIQMGQFRPQKRFLLRQGVCLGQGLFERLFQRPRILNLLLRFRQFRFQGWDLSGFIVTAAVELLFQGICGFGKGRILFAGGNERGNPAAPDRAS